jgi:hypothetical protein
LEIKQVKKKKIRYHELHSNVERRTNWLNAIDANCGFKERTFRNTAGRTYTNTFVCQAHFEETCYEGNKKKMKLSAIPAKFPTFVVGYPRETRKR